MSIPTIATFSFPAHYATEGLVPVQRDVLNKKLLDMALEAERDGCMEFAVRDLMSQDMERSDWSFQGPKIGDVIGAPECSVPRAPS